MKLAEYRKKRDPAATNEPFGPEPPDRAAPTTAGVFVIHLHDASRTHYDLRVEIGGVLTSFAVPKGPSLDPATRHLAVMTEDHPMEYLDFEAVIPDGQYGAGPMILWDRGRVRYLDGSAEAGVERGKLDFELDGLKVRGRFALVRIKGGKNEWLMLKKTDAFARPGSDIVTEKPRSILSGLTIDELAKIPSIAIDLERQAKELGAPEADVDGRGFVPMLCAMDGAPDHGEGWLYELKLDGVRELATKDGNLVALTNRKLRDNTATYPEVARAVKALAAPRVVLDGEIVAFDERGHPSFQRLGQRMHVEKARDVRRAMVDVPVSFIVFDILAIGGRDLRPLATVDRKRLLHALIPAPGILRVLDHVEGDGRKLLAFCRERHLEGVVAKRKDAPYRPGPKRGDAWVKMKCERDEDFAVVGYTRGERNRDRMGAIDLAAYERGVFVYRGKVGSGLDAATIDALLARLAPLVTAKQTAKGTYTPTPRGRTHVKPELVVRVRFLGYTNEAQLRQPVFVGVRDDVRPEECTSGPPYQVEAQLETEAEAEIATETKEDAPPAAKNIELPGITNRAKVLFPEDGYTKEDLWRYYEAIAPAMLRYLRDRPIMMVRYPDGIRGKLFYQWNVPLGIPPWIRTCRIVAEEKGDEVEVFLVDDARTLLYVANLAAIPIHVLAARVPALDKADFLTIDFDVGLSSLVAGVTLAKELRGILDAIGLEGFPKTSGQTGLHVFVPVGGANYVTTCTLADVLGRLLVQRHPDIATMTRVVSKRGARVYVDTGQTGPTRTIVAPYSVRAQRGATVSTPLTWDEVTPELDPSRFSIKTVPARVLANGDPMERLLEVRPDVRAAVAKLEKLLSKG